MVIFPAAFVLVLVLGLFADLGDGQVTSPGVPFEYSDQDDMTNQETAITYFEKKYYNSENKWSLDGADLEEAFSLAKVATEKHVLALAAAQVLYLYAWYRRDGGIIRESVVMAAQLFETSISAMGCSNGISTEEWLMRACDIRVGQALILDNWLGETDSDPSRGQEYRRRAYEILSFVKTVPRFAAIGKSWEHPLHMNFNQLRYNNLVSKPIWDNSEVPLAQFFEANHHIFKEELDAILNDPRDVYEVLRKADGSIESLAPPGTWDAIRIVRYGNWFEPFCEVAPRTCALLRGRPEIAQCPYVNANYYMLHPGGHLKPHFGNAPRLTAHLTVINPEPLKSGISVGDKKSLWAEGKALILDDTYPHSVSHWGTKPRYVLATWFCHPCDENNDPGPDAVCPDWVKKRVVSV